MVETRRKLRAKVYEWQGSYLEEVKARHERDKEIANLHGELEAKVVALARVRRLHRPILYVDPVNGGRSQRCVHCSGRTSALYPCETLRAIEGCR